jgi:hypothetical protein
MYVLVHAQGIETVHPGGVGFKKWKNSVHVVVECPLIHKSVVRAPAQVSDHCRSYRSLLHSGIGGNVILMGRLEFLSKPPCKCIACKRIHDM